MTNKEAIKYLQQLYTNGGHCWLDEQRIEAIGMAVKALQGEPVSEDLKEAANAYAVTVYNNYLDNPKAFENKDADTLNEDAFKAGAKWKERQFEKNRLAHCDKQTKEEAEKDLELTWEDMMLIHKCIKDAMNYHLYKMMEGVEGQKIVYQEVLKRFKDLKKEVDLEKD